MTKKYAPPILHWIEEEFEVISNWDVEKNMPIWDLINIFYCHLVYFYNIRCNLLLWLYIDILQGKIIPYPMANISLKTLRNTKLGYE